MNVPEQPTSCPAAGNDSHICVRVAVTFCDAQDFMLIPDNLIVLEREFAGTVGIQDMRLGEREVTWAEQCAAINSFARRT